MRKLRLRGQAVIVIGIAVLALGASTSFGQNRGVEFLDQGWSADEREEFYTTAQGSQLIPLDWFLVLEAPGDATPFRDAAHMDRLRYLAHPRSRLNPHGLPVGFVVDTDVDETQTAAKNAYIQSRFPKKSSPQVQKSFLGLTCAACHTGRIEFGNRAVQVDGAPTMADLQTFLVELAAALTATHEQPDKLARFAKALKVQDTESLKMGVAARAAALQALVKRNDSAHRYGFARLDAFGAILNAVCDDALGLPANNVKSSAPVSYPQLWDTPHMDWVQWNSSSSSALTRNVGEVLGVFGHFTLTPAPGKRNQFDSTVKLQSLRRLESLVARLKTPVWPEDLLGKLDEQRIARGRALFAANCAVCHPVRDAQGNYKMVDVGGQSRIQTHAIPLNVIKTDPQMILNLGSQVDPGVLREFLPPDLKQCEKVARGPLLAITVARVIQNRAAAEGVTLPPAPTIRPPLEGSGYKSGPLEGVWATAPFLHNGSVPNLFELLKPSAQRSPTFFVGSRRFDPVNVGFETGATPGAFEFRVKDGNGPIPGNSNAGHEGHRFTQTMENGVWRDFTDDERWALVEYMKALGHAKGRGDVMAAETVEQTLGQTATEQEIIPKAEAAQIETILKLTVQQLKNRYPAPDTVRRGVHAKDHGCVKASFVVEPGLEARYRIGMFAEPGRKFDAWVRFSNAAVRDTDDNPIDPANPTRRSFGSRGMAIKVLGVPGTSLVPQPDGVTQDFLMVNHPVFAFANVEDYEVLSEVLADPANNDSPGKFFAIQIGKGGLAAARAARTLGIVRRIQAPDVASGGYQPQPATPVDCTYFSGAPFLFGDGHVMKFSAVPMHPVNAVLPDVARRDYLREGLIKRLAAGDGATPARFKFRVQVRSLTSLNLAVDIEDACTEWPECRFPFVDVATVTIEPQDFDSPERRELCESLVFTPWHSTAEFRPLGGINRMRLGVYEASAAFRRKP